MHQEGDMEAMEEWDVRRSLFDGHMSRDMEANLEYMWKKFGFYFPEADLLKDPEGLLKYLVSPKLPHQEPTFLFCMCM